MFSSRPLCQVQSTIPVSPNTVRWHVGGMYYIQSDRLYGSDWNSIICPFQIGREWGMYWIQSITSINTTIYQIDSYLIKIQQLGVSATSSGPPETIIDFSFMGFEPARAIAGRFYSCALSVDGNVCIQCLSSLCWWQSMYIIIALFALHKGRMFRRCKCPLLLICSVWICFIHILPLISF